MFQVRKTDKRSNITYVYNCENKWSKEEKKVKCCRTLIGKIGDDGEIISTDGRGHRRGTRAKENPIDSTEPRKKRYKQLWEKANEEIKSLKEQLVKKEEIIKKLEEEIKKIKEIKKNE